MAPRPGARPPQRSSLCPGTRLGGGPLPPTTRRWKAGPPPRRRAAADQGGIARRHCCAEDPEVPLMIVRHWNYCRPSRTGCEQVRQEVEIGRCPRCGGGSPTPRSERRPASRVPSPTRRTSTRSPRAPGACSRYSSALASMDAILTSNSTGPRTAGASIMASGARAGRVLDEDPPSSRLRLKSAVRHISVASAT